MPRQNYVDYTDDSATRLPTDSDDCSIARDELDKQALEYLTKFCDQCQKNGRSPGRFKFVLKDDTIDFNHSILIDVIYIDGSPVFHIVDDATRFQAARWLKNLSARHNQFRQQGIQAICQLTCNHHEGRPRRSESIGVVEIPPRLKTCLCRDCGRHT
jgi:hypothetical protein